MARGGACAWGAWRGGEGLVAGGRSRAGRPHLHRKLPHARCSVLRRHAGGDEGAQHADRDPLAAERRRARAVGDAHACVSQAGREACFDRAPAELQPLHPLAEQRAVEGAHDVALECRQVVEGDALGSLQDGVGRRVKGRVRAAQHRAQPRQAADHLGVGCVRAARVDRHHAREAELVEVELLHLDDDECAAGVEPGAQAREQRPVGDAHHRVLLIAERGQGRVSTSVQCISRWHGGGVRARADAACVRGDFFEERGSGWSECRKGGRAEAKGVWAGCADAPPWAFVKALRAKFRSESS